MYVIKFNNKYYWCGYNKVDAQIRKAVIYKTRKIAEHVLMDLVKTFGPRVQKQVGKLLSADIIEVELKEKESNE